MSFPFSFKHLKCHCVVLMGAGLFHDPGIEGLFNNKVRLWLYFFIVARNQVCGIPEKIKALMLRIKAS